MRGLWSQEQTLTPYLLRSAMLLLGILLGVLAAANVGLALRLLIGGAWISAVAQLASGLAVPFAIWLGVRILTDVLALQHRSLDRFEAMSEGRPFVDPPKPEGAAARVVEGPAADDGVAYPQD